MTAVRKNLTVDHGTTLRLTVRYLDSNRNPVNLTGYAVTFVLLTVGQENGTPLFTKTAEVTADGYINLKAVDEETALWEAGKKAYRLDCESPDGDIDRLLYGALEVRSGVNV